jgi:hypothetical protein
MRVRLRRFRQNARLVDCVMLGALLSLALFAGCGEQYAPTGPTWASVAPLYYSLDSGAGANTQLAFDAAVADWNAANTPADFQPGSGDFPITLDEEDDPDVRWDGICRVSYSDGSILEVEASLNAHYTDTYPSIARRSVACHELGHVLGLDDFDGEVLMNGATGVRFFEYGIYLPQQGDIDGVNAMYG